jgi:anaerobic selenocysteine-containing dehydrogenase
VCAPEPIADELKRCRQELLEKPEDPRLKLIGRRHLLSANSWLHNFQRLVKGRERCLLFMHPSDLSAHGLATGQTIRVTSRVGQIRVKVQATDEIMPGVVSLPHGWGHDRPHTRLSIARQHPGVNLNDLTDEKQYDGLSGNAVLNGIPITISAE